jgi:hypothetical protein
MPDYNRITEFIMTPLIFRYHLPLSFFFCRAGEEEEVDPYLEMGDDQLLQLAHSCLMHEQPGSFEHSIRYKIEQLLSGNG